MGPSGSGKSRLLREVRQHCQLARHLFLEGQCYGEALEPYVAWEAVVAQAASFIGPAVQAHTALLNRVSPKLATRLGLTPELENLDSRKLAKHMVELLLAVGGPCIISIGDLQWIDPMSLELLELVLERCANLQRERPLRLAFLLTSREDVPEAIRHTVQRLRSTALNVALRPLDSSQVGTLVASMLGTTDIAPSLSEALALATGGNALLVIEVMHAWVKDGTLSPQASGWTLRRTRSAREIGLQLTHLLSDRLAELSALALQALRALAVFGKPLSLEWLGALLQVEREPVLALLGELRSKHFAFLSADGCVHFSAARWKDSVNETIEPEARAEIHARLAELVAASADAALVAFHYERGANSQNAALWYGRAALNSFQRGELKLTLEYAEKSAACGATGIAFGEVCTAAAEAGRLCGDSRAGPFAKRALSLLPPGSLDWLRASRVAIAMSNPFASS
jgi:predicted ATPase